MPTVVIEIKGDIIEQYHRSNNQEAFKLADELKHRYKRLFEWKKVWSIYVVTRSSGGFGHRRAVSQHDLKGRMVREFASVMEAERETGVDERAIRRAAIGKRYTAGGYRWKYV